MNQPRPESRISALEKRASTPEATIEELSADTAEELKAIRQDIKQLSEGITASYTSIGDTFIATWDDIKATLATKENIGRLEARFDKVEGDITALKATMATKDDISKLEARFGKVEGDITALKTTMATKDDIAAIKATQDLVLQLLQQKGQ